MKTFKDLTIGTVVSFTNSSNPTTEFVVLDTYTDEWGTWVNLLAKEDNRRDNVTAHTQVGGKFERWQLVS